MFEVMRYLRRSGSPALSLAILMAIGILVPEAGHSFAHHEAQAHVEHHAASDVYPGAGKTPAISSGHPGDGHPHFERSPILPGKTLLPDAAAVQTVLFLHLEFGGVTRLPAAAVPTRPPPESNHGPPPPARAPPLV
jgi:hypothetical protein